MKMIIFLILLGIAIVPYTADGFMNIVPSGIIIVGPCLIIFFLFFLVTFFWDPGKSHPFLLESMKICPNCKAKNTGDAVYCHQCQTKIASDQILFGETISCKTCKSINPVGSKFCMNCGEVFTPKKKKK